MKRYLAEFDVREKSPLIVGVILAWLGLNLAFTFFVNLPRSLEVTRLQEGVTHVAGLTTSRQREIEVLREQHTRVVQGSGELREFYDEILATKGERMIAFQKEIRAIAQKYRIDLKSINYSTEAAPTKDKLARFGASMPLTGSYESLRDFVHTIERSPQFIIINSIELSSSKEGGIILGLSISLSTYFKDPEMPDRDAPEGRGRRSSG